MPLDSVLQEIERKGQDEIKRINEEAKKEVEKILAEAETEAKNIIAKAREEVEKEAEALRRQEISSLNLELKRILLNKQKEISEEVFNLLKKKIAEMDTNTKKKILKALISKNAKNGMLIYAKKEDKKLMEEILKELKLNLKIAGEISALGGIILEEASGEIRINLTFDEMISQLYEKKLSDVAKVLFG